METNPKSIFDHEFEGYSVWLEPCPNDAKDVIKEMQKLSFQCGGSKSGTHPFALHCTLLYNFNPDRLILEHHEIDDGDMKGKNSNHEELGMKTMLESCVQQYKDSVKEKLPKLSSSEDEKNRHNQNNDQTKLFLNPTEFYFFPYPKHADDGRGFGCVISMLLLEKNENIQLIQKIVSEIFPPDERHGKNHTTTTSCKNDKMKNDQQELKHQETMNNNINCSKTKKKETLYLIWH